MSIVGETREELLEQLARLHQKIEQLDRITDSESLADGAASAPQVSSMLGMIGWDLQFRISYWSPEAEQTFGWRQDEVLGKQWDEFPFVHPGDIQRVTNVGLALINGTVDFNTCSNRNYRKDGTILECEWFNAVRHDDQGCPISWVSIAHNVTDRVRAENHIRQVRNAMHLIIGGTSRFTGGEFFEALVRYVSESLGFRYVFIARTEEGCDRTGRTVAFWADGAAAPEIEYAFVDTPCERVQQGTMQFYPDRIQQLFPKASVLAQFHARSYLGAPLISSSGNVLGVLAAIDDKPMEDRPDIRAIIGLFADRTAVELERVEIEKARRESETRLRILTEQMPAILWTTDHDLRVTHVTGAGLSRINVSANEIQGQLLADFLGTNDVNFRPISSHLRALNGISGASEIQWSGRTFHVYVEPLRDGTDQIIGTIGVAQDISDLKRIEQSLVASEERFRRLVEYAPEAVVLLDIGSGRFVTANRSAAQMFKMSAAELCQLGPLDVSPEVQPDGQSSKVKSRQVISRALAGETPIFEWVHLDSEGREVPCEIRLLSLEDGGNTLVRGSMIDITEKKRAEESQKRLESELARVARVSMMGEMVGGLAHELNQPLYAIQNFGKACGNLVAEDGDFDRDRLREWLEKIISTAESAGDILTRLRNFVSREPLVREAIDLSEVIETALMLTKHDAQVGGIRVEYTKDESLPLVHVDAVQIQQVLVNLLRNAFDATQEKSHGTPFVKIMTKKEGDLVTVTVADNGPGLPPDASQIFAAFSSTKLRGLGLGLAIGKTIIEAHGGTLTAKNGGDCGAEFCFTLSTNGSPEMAS
ncbi:MAG: PAS domain S-box protein [Planctomycetales bacterium]|nr:PAS domain S-box protein [Planctomycetales bacterium]